MLNIVYNNDSSLLRKGDYFKESNGLPRSYPGLHVDLAQVSVMHAGWHCSWCFQPEGIRAKLLDAPNSDFPRYGSDKAKVLLYRLDSYSQCFHNNRCPLFCWKF